MDVVFGESVEEVDRDGDGLLAAQIGGVRDLLRPAVGVLGLRGRLILIRRHQAHSLSQLTIQRR